MNKVMSKQVFYGRSQQNLKILSALLALDGKSDREVAKLLGINNSTLSRRRRKLEQDGFIKEYTILPDFYKIGLEVLVFSFSSTTDQVPPENSKALEELAQRHPEVLCLLEDQGLEATNWFAITAHRNYDDFIELIKKVKKELMPLGHLPHVETKRIVIHTNNLYPKPFSLRNLGELFQPTIQSNHKKNAKYDAKVTPINVQKSMKLNKLT